MASYDLRSMSDEDFEAEYHRRLASKSPADAGKSIAQSALISTGGAEVTAPNRSEPVNTPQNYIAEPRQAKFIGQSGEIRTGPADISQTAPSYNRQGEVTGYHSILIDARAPVKYGGGLTSSSLTPEDQWRGQFTPSVDLQALNNRRDTLNAASRVKNPGYDPVADILQLRKDNAIYSTQQQQRIVGTPLAQNTDDNGLGNDPFRKFFGGGLPTPTPTPIPTPPKMVEEVPYWRKKEDQYA